MPSEEVTSEAIEDTLAMLNEMGINVVESEEADGEQRPGASGGGGPMFGLGSVSVHDACFRESGGCYRVAAVVRKPNATARVEFGRCPC
jgi:RNA polymerase primary sigma factor